MQDQNNEKKVLLTHHEQQSLCTTRLPYRQGRKLTAVKVYSITKESNHLLIFGVPSLNLRQESKMQFLKFGKLLQFNISKEHVSEPFTETYHAQYEKIQSARLAKRMLDTKNFYGGSLHVCYAPEFENVDETRKKLIQRQRDVVFRLKNLQKEKNGNIATPPPNDVTVTESVKLNMGEVNTIFIGKPEDNTVLKKKKKKLKNELKTNCTDNKRLKMTKESSIITDCYNDSTRKVMNNSNENMSEVMSNITDNNITNGNVTIANQSNVIDVVDCTNVDEEVITNINEGLNYNKFGNEVIRKIPQKPLNKIQFHINKKS